MKENSLPRLFQPGVLGTIRLKNRIVMLPMGTAYASAIGEVTQKTIDYYVERARGGVGMITVGGTSPFGTKNLNQLVLDADWFMAGHYELVEAVHAEDVPICIQLNHPGRQWYPCALDTLEGRQPVSASDVQCFYLGEHPRPKPRPLRKEEIYQIMDKWAEAAGRGKKVGYDMVEIHAGHGYLCEQFMSPYTNKRTDEFGGSLENRMRFPLELLKRVKKVVGDNFPVGFRLGAEEFVEGGITIKDSPAMAKILEDAGAAYLSVTCGIHDTHDKVTDVMRQPEGWKHYIWETIKQATNVPIIGGGGLRTPAFCESILAQGKADFIGLGRPLLADPRWANKAREGTIEDIRPCISCLECMHGSYRRRQGGGARRCSINAATGREGEFLPIRPASVKKKVMVIGGGPAGMEAAWVAAVRGHDVSLYEKGEELGGALLLASVPPGKAKIELFRNYLKTQITKARVKVKLRTEVTPDLVEKENPDVVIVATGARPVKPQSFTTTKDIPTAWDVLGGKVEIHDKRVIVVGGGMVGVETAEYLAHCGNTVTVVEMLATLASDMEMHNRFGVLQALKEASVTVLTRTEVVEVVEGGIIAVDKDSGEKGFIQGDAVVFAIGAVANRDVAEALEGKFAEVYLLGDCNEPRVIMEAVYEGARVARRV
ncbi:MAG: FAD-dependent oxidoreductase [Chloroflexi bacterium]|nr:FAD-dependent oxidoreductase [Chloroflexota bacterium]